MPTSFNWIVFFCLRELTCRFVWFKLFPLKWLKIESPEVIYSIILFFFSTEDVHFAFEDAGRMSTSWRWLQVLVALYIKPIMVWYPIFFDEIINQNFICALSSFKSTKDIPLVIIFAWAMSISTDNLWLFRKLEFYIWIIPLTHS